MTTFPAANGNWTITVTGPTTFTLDTSTAVGTSVAEGTWAGEVDDAPRGNGGFGYDPHFMLPALGKTAAELSAEEKNTVSHRALALQGLVARLQTHGLRISGT